MSDQIFIKKVVGHGQGGDETSQYHLGQALFEKATTEASVESEGLLPASQALLVEYVSVPESDGSLGVTYQRAADASSLYIKTDDGWRTLDAMGVWLNVVDDGIIVVDGGDPVIDSSP